MTTKTIEEVAAEVIDSAANRIARPWGWCKGTFQKQTWCPSKGEYVTTYCLVGSIFDAESEVQYTTEGYYFSPLALNKTIMRALRMECPPTPGEYYSGDEDHLVCWNDNVAKDKRYVLRLFKRASKALRKGVK